jgi:hypothetical protein
MYLKEIYCEGVDWMHMEQDRGQWRALVNTVLNLGWVRQKLGKNFTGQATVSFSRSALLHDGSLCCKSVLKIEANIRVFAVSN